MRLQLIPILLAIIINVGIDALIVVKLRKLQKPKWMQHIHLALSFFLLALIIVAVAMPRRSIGNDGLCAIMWMLFSYFSCYAAKYIALLLNAAMWAIVKLRKKALQHRGIISAAISTFAFIAMWWGSLVTAKSIEVKRVEMEFANLPVQFDGYTIAQFSDFHLGSYGTNTSFPSLVVDSINNLDADLIVFTGDLVNRCTAEAEPFVPVLSKLKARDGVLSILGNHDYGDYMSWDSPEDRTENNARLCSLQREMGWNLLNNSDTIINRGENHICIIGVENWGEPPFPKYGKLSKAHHALNDSDFKILLSHNSRHWRGEVIPKSNIDLMLAGHTHAMQIELNFFCLRMSPSAWRYDEWGGLYEQDSQKLYVNIGLGVVAIPMRLGATPEITLITLKRKK
ncbi:MAG: metallophosphoesterase [Muribaculaceae bacterium]